MRPGSGTGSGGARGRRRIAAVAAALIICVSSAPAWAMQVLDAVDHAELEAEVSATAVNRIALGNDRIARVVRGPDGFRAEHDPASGDLYLRPMAPADGAAMPASATLFIGTEKGFTYRLTLTAAERESAQILIRNPDAIAAGSGSAEADARIGALAGLIRAVANREPPAGFVVETGARASYGSFPVVEVWRGPRFTAEIVEAGPGIPHAAALAARAGSDVAAAWLAPAADVRGERIAVVVRETAPERRSGGSR